MKRFTKWLSGMMAVIMLLGLLPTAAFAVESGDNPSSGAKTAITVTTQDAQQPTKKIGNCGIKLERVTSGRYESFGIKQTTNQGTATWGSLEPGWYRITQVTVAEGYKTNNAPIVRWFGSDESMHEVTIENYSQRSLTIKRMTNATTPVKDAKFEVRDTNGGIVATLTTDSTGTAYLPFIAPGDYTVTEVFTPTGVDPVSVAKNPQSLHVQQADSGDYALMFDSSEQPSLLIHYLERVSHKGIAGAVFSLYREPDELIQANIKTDASGLATVSNLKAGTYTLRQTYMPEGYVNKLESTDFKVTVGNDGNIIKTFYGDIPATVTILVADSQTGLPLAGAEVKLYSQGNKLVAGPQKTNGEGLVTFAGIADGNYTVVVDGAPRGYVMDSTTMSITVSANQDIQEVFTATIAASLCIYLQDETGKPLVGDFTVRHQNGTKVGTYKTGVNGEIVIPDLADGYYVVEQNTAPAGYVMTNATQTVRVTAGRMAELTFINRAKPFIVVNGYISKTTIGVPAATYELRDTNNNFIMSSSADANGQVIFEDLTPGNYVIKCVNVPEGYTLVTNAQTVTVTKQKAGQATFFFDRHSSIIVNALDSVTGDPLVGTMFQVRNENGTVIELITTSIDGVAVTKTLTPGKYIVQEYYAPEGYVADTNFQTVMVENNKTSVMTFTQSKKPVIVIYACDADYMPLVGVQYTVLDGVTGKQVASFVTDTSGTATTSPLEPGSYIVKQMNDPEGYILTTSYQMPVTVTGDAATYVTFPHYTQDVVSIATVDITTRNPVGGAQYEVTNLNTNWKGTFTASASGTVEVGHLEPGKYLVKQTHAPEGYRICTESQTIEVVSGRALNLTFANYKLSGIAIEAVVQGSHTKLANVTFEIYDENNKQVFHGTTDASGYLSTDTLAAGKYTIKQLATPDGYTAVETTKVVTVSYDELTTVVFENKVHTSLVIELVDSENKAPLAGSRFKIESIDGAYSTTVVTDEGGTATVTGLAAGKYMVTQVEAPDGYILEGSYQWAEMKVGVNITYVKFTNNRISGLTIRALDRNTNKPLAGATFEIYEENGKLVQTVTTDVTGIMTVTKLTAGTYLVKEIKGPEGYQIDTATQKITITKNANDTLTFYHVANAEATLKAVVATSGQVVSGVTFNITKVNGDFVGQFTTGANGLVQLGTLEPGQYVVNILSVPDGYLLDTTPRTITIKTNVTVLETFELNVVTGLTVTVNEAQTGAAVKDVELKITTLTGTLVGNYTTNSVGIVNVSLEPGEYIVYQTRVPDGYVMDPKPHNIVVKGNVQTTLELEVTKESHVRIKVVNAATQVGVYNVQIEVLDEHNNYIGRYTTDNEGYIHLDTVLASGRYKLNMLSVPEGFIRDTVIKTVTVELKSTTDIVWPITGKQGQLTITTLSSSDNILMGIFKNSRLSGAVYTITDMTGKVVATIYGDSYGEAHSGALAIGTYYIQQTQAPAGYMINDQRVTVNVTNTNDNIKITVYNKSGNFATSVEAHGPTTVGVNANAKFFYTNVCNKSSVAVSNFFLHIKVPTDGARAGTFYTGTWTGVPSTYYIEYKTNMSDYRILAQGLNSKSQYSYDLSSLAMAFGAGEYVTDIRMVFPTAAAGMRESMAPVLYVRTLPVVVNGYQLINRAEAGCQGQVSASVSTSVNGNPTSGSAASGAVGASISDGWVSSSSQSTTVVRNYAYQYPIPSRLPKTGY